MLNKTKVNLCCPRSFFATHPFRLCSLEYAMIAHHFPVGKAKPNRGAPRRDSSIWALAQALHAYSPRGGLSEAKVLWDKLASGCDRGCRYVRRACASTGEDARHRYLTPGLIMQATNGVLSCPIHLGPLLLLCHGPCVAAERLLPRRCDNAGQSNARDARHPGRMLRNKQSRNPTPKKEESLPRR